MITATLLAALAASGATTLTFQVRAEVPVTCSTASVVSSQVVGDSARLSIVGACNAPHSVRVFYDGATVTTPFEVALNGDTRVGAGSELAFPRQAYFRPASTMTIKVQEHETERLGALLDTIRIEITAL